MRASAPLPIYFSLLLLGAAGWWLLREPPPPASSTTIKKESAPAKKPRKPFSGWASLPQPLHTTERPGGVLKDEALFSFATDEELAAFLRQAEALGGRVLGITAWANGLTAAREQAYDCLEQIRFPGMHFRQDIGLKALG